MGLSLPSFLLLTAASLHVAVGGPQCDPRNVTTSSALGLMAALLTDYDQQRPPEQPTSIGLLMEINDIFTIDTRKDAFWLDMVLHARWVDCRLAYDPARNEGVEWVKWPRDIWQPDWKVSGLRETIFEQARWAVLSRPDGLVYMSAKFPAKYKCTMDLSLLPFDTQTCNWTVSTSWPSQYVRLEMWEPVAQGAPKIEELHSTSGDFGLQLHPVSNREWLFANLTTKRVEFYNVGLHKPSDGARLQFTIHRRHYWYTVNIVIPSMFMWVINYSSLYMSPDAAPARVALAVLPILILISLSSRVFSSIPIIRCPNPSASPHRPRTLDSGALVHTLQTPVLFRPAVLPPSMILLNVHNPPQPSTALLPPSHGCLLCVCGGVRLSFLGAQ